jgi:hypothetical protein
MAGGWSSAVVQQILAGEYTIPTGVNHYSQLIIQEFSQNEEAMMDKPT